MREYLLSLLITSRLRLLLSLLLSGLSIEQICTELNIKRSVYHQRRFRLLKRLKKLI